VIPMEAKPGVGNGKISLTRGKPLVGGGGGGGGGGAAGGEVDCKARLRLWVLIREAGKKRGEDDKRCT